MSNQLTIEEAEKIMEKYLGQIEDKEDAEFLSIHSRYVVEVALMISSRESYKHCNKEFLKIAGYVHDIGRFVSEEDHARHSLEILESDGYEIDEVLKDCILNHGNGKSPQTDEGKIIQMADKLSFIN